ncbi:hypothetical protein [Methanobacterium sp.]|uniref:hypothetical protein n=1 Tax=Methanobacterium sp. TaxID=2164 RepID=UPI003C73BF7E
MKKRDFKKDNKAQIFSIDVLLALIVITVILGISADAMDMVSYKAQDYSSRLSLERTTADAADMLIKSSGSPDNWEDYGISVNTVPGLAKKEECLTVPNSLSFVKILKLKGHYNQLMYGSILPYGMNSSMMIYPLDPSLSPIIVMNNTVPESASEVVVANRTVLCDFMHISAVIKIKGYKDQQWQGENKFEGEVCPHMDHKQHDSKIEDLRWACNHFNVTVGDLNSTDFYMVTDPVYVTDFARWGIDRADAQMNCNEKFNNEPISVNDKIASVMGNDTKAVMWFHILAKEDPRDSFDGYIISVPKGMPLNQVKLNYVGPEPCFFVLQVWY